MSLHHSALVDSLVPIASTSASVSPSDPTQLASGAIVIAVSFLAFFTVATIIFFLVRYWMRRAAVKRRRQASWILRSGQWNMEPKRTHAHETRSSFSDASSFATYPYPLSEHYQGHVSV